MQMAASRAGARVARGKESYGAEGLLSKGVVLS